jgi:hypothetical protein
MAAVCPVPTLPFSAKTPVLEVLKREGLGSLKYLICLAPHPHTRLGLGERQGDKAEDLNCRSCVWG